MTTLSVIVPTHNPHRARLARVLEALSRQTLSLDRWEFLLVDNFSTPTLSRHDILSVLPAALEATITRADPAGLTVARKAGIAAAKGDLILFVDDDNVLAPDYLARVLQHFEAHPRLGAIGGKSLPEFEQPRPSWWQPEFDGLIACRDLGDAPQFASDRHDPQNGRRLYPHCAPLGAGMALRRSAVQGWLDDSQSSSMPDRRGAELSSGGDNDISLTLLRAGWDVAYFPDLALTHLIPAARVQRDYLARLNRGISKSWIQVLHRHQANPWSPIRGWTVPARQLKAWFTYRAWAGPAQFIRWQGACGHFEGLAAIRRSR